MSLPRLLPLLALLASLACGSPPVRAGVAVVADGQGPDVVTVDAARDVPEAPDVTQSLDGTEAPDLPDAFEVLDAQAKVDAGPAGMRDWTAHPAILQRPMPTDLWFLGDIHGDYKRARALLNGAGLADLPQQPEQVHWLAGPAVLVVTGDFIDKENHGLQVIAWLRALQASAQAQGGDVILTLGNHEAEFLADPMTSKVIDFAKELQDAGLSPQAVAQGQDPLGVWLRELPVAVKLGSWFACHAGDTHGASLDALDLGLRKGMDAHGFAAPVLLDEASLLEQKLDPPWWETGPGQAEANLTAAVQALGVEHIVQGHQPGKVQFSDGTKRKSGQVFQKFGRVFLIDAGMSKAVDDSLGALLHVHHGGAGDEATVVQPDGSVTALWSDQ